MATILKNAREWIAVFCAATLLVACGGGGSSTADTTPPTVSAFSVKNGAAINASSDASYAVSGNVGTTQEYTITFSEKLGAASYAVQMLDSSNALVALPTGMTATLTANDASNLAYTLTITTSGSFAFDAGQTSKVVKLQATVADASQNTAKMNITETVNHVDTAGTASITGPTLSSGSVNLILSASDADGIHSWEISYIRTRNSGADDAPVVLVNGTGIPPTSYLTNHTMLWAVGNKSTYYLKIQDARGNTTKSLGLTVTEY
ncbi:MAG: hypothetical protein RL297_2305 [Pseudomonadota bacterium]|jgi:hypothetical protein